jgi:hypothetical protein
LAGMFLGSLIQLAINLTGMFLGSLILSYCPLSNVWNINFM